MIKTYYEINKKKIKLRQKKYYLVNKDKIKKQHIKWKKKNIIRIKKQTKIYYIKNKELIRLKNKMWIKNNKNRIKFLQKQWLKINNKKSIEYRKEHYLKNKKRIQKNHKKTHDKRIKNDVNYKLRLYCRSRIYNAIKRNTKSGRTLKLLGCSIKMLKKHLETKFTEGMSWDNHGAGNNGKGMQEWHIDHIKPCASFDLSKASEQRKCFHYTNLQPLWASINRKKCNNQILAEVV